MKIKRYLARDMQEAYLAIRRDLGPEAVIVATRQVRRPGLWGFFQPPRLEVTAALDTAAGGPGGAKANGAGAYPPAGAATAPAGAVGMAEATATAGPVGPPGGAPAFPLAAAPDRGGFPAFDGLRRELADIKTALARLARPEGSATSPWQQALQDQELAADLVVELTAGLEATAGPEVVGGVVRNRLAERLAGQVAAASRQRVQAFIGPTGVGKTTTLAKVAARYSIYQEQKVGLITLDTYRIGAVDQLRTYAEIMGLPLEVAMTPREFREALEHLGDRDIILVDTAGRAPENKAMLAETRGFLEAMPGGDVYLVLSSATRRQDLLQAVERFRPLHYNHLIFTKLDETSCPGVVVTVTAAAGVPLAYITTGQDVPDDLEVADPHYLAERIWKAVARNGSGGQVA
ncbi:flagellar biosynthesis protein FlhF [Moorella sp. Hama-1]|uniref:flagellar biosynthesis protein FlhF n=1 Tax=Moorella sp. Hama-1 TaxID=2138101 RepID=UPI000D65D9AC|nr:flagellar biosynthesis protein FlhF [Moorella sp. Hama-1]MDN5361803.1 flagellar biosynthesis protein FlhF [Moorella sp. (in: firmicutes)]BCV20828.1 flagellar biosynthesis protein FlhF [Moorella sp. Hama-1]